MRMLLTFAFVAAGFLLSEPKTYVEALRSYDGAAYLDETCSALICKAHEKVGKTKAECTAKELWEGCGGKLEEVANAASLAKLDWRQVKPGDVLALNGVHVVAYLGDGQCIDSDPLQGGVAEVSAESLIAKTGDAWFNGPVRVERWVK